MRVRHEPRVEKWRDAAAAFRIIMPQEAVDQLAFFERVVTRDIAESQSMTQSEMIAWLETLDANGAALVATCRGLVR